MLYAVITVRPVSEIRSDEDSLILLVSRSFWPVMRCQASLTACFTFSQVLCSPTFELVPAGLQVGLHIIPAPAHVVLAGLEPILIAGTEVFILAAGGIGPAS